MSAPTDWPLVLRVLPIALAAGEVLLVLALLHVPIAAAMRARGLAGWRLRDTALTVPLLTLALAVAFGAMNVGLAQLAHAARAGARWGPSAVGATVATLGALVVAAFGARAVRKLF